MLTPEERVSALRRARRAIHDALGPEEETMTPPIPAPSGVFAEPRGVFVTLRRFPGDDLRGCIGYALPVFPLATAIERAAVAAAVDDPRFAPLRAVDLARITVEVSVLTVPELIPPGDASSIVAAVQVGRDGLIVEGMRRSGLLLPQVAAEQGWSTEELLAGTCEKAGLPPGAWRDPSVRIRRFEAEVFRERTPGGEITEGPTIRPPAARSGPRT